MDPSTVFNRRVRLLVEVADHPDEIALAEQLLVAEGCLVRTPLAGEDAPIGPHRSALVVEVRLSGARRGARRAAVDRVERIAAQARLGLWVRRSELLEPPRERRTLYRVRLVPPTEGRPFARWLLRAARQLDGSHDQRALSRPGPPDRAAAVAELTGSRLGVRTFDPTAESVHGPANPPENGDGSPQPEPPSEPTEADSFLALCLKVTAFVACALVCVTIGGALQELASPWRWAALPPALAVGIAFPPLVGLRPLSRPRHLAVGLGASTSFQYLGYQLMLALPANGGDVLWRIVLTVLGVGLVAWTIPGLRWALAPSWFSRNANWLVPAVIAPLYFVLPWFGRLLYTLYLTVGFGIPVEAVPVTTYSMMYAALKPVGLAAGFALIFVAAAGWARHAYWGGTRGGGIPSFVLPVVAVQYILTALLVGLITAGTAWGDAADAVRSGRNPPGYYGLHGTLMCVTPHSKDIAVYNGPLITDRTVLTFGSTGDRIWLWGPQDAGHGEKRWTSTSVRLEDVSLAPPPDGEMACPGP